MFNAPRSPSNRYGAPLSNGLLGSSTSITSDPLVASAYIDPDAGLDPWSVNPSPAPLADPPSALNAVLGVSMARCSCQSLGLMEYDRGRANTSSVHTLL